MNRIKLAPNLYLDEYIPKSLYLKYVGREHILAGLIDQSLVKADQMLRDEFGAVTINNWWDGGTRAWSGLRLPESPDYSLTSQHTYGRASDKLFEKYGAQQVRDFIAKNWKQLGITCIEANVSWVHSDVRFVQNQSNLLIVYP